jgi:hypothetical protein
VLRVWLRWGVATSTLLAVITNVYVDGFNLYYGCLRKTKHKWLDLSALCARLLPPNRVQRIRYFTATVSPRPDDPQSPARQAAYLRALRTIPEVSVHFGHFLVSTTRMPLAHPVPNGPKTVEVIKTEEKGSDVNLATYLLADAFTRDAQCFVVITNDSDLAEPIRMVRHDLGLRVGIVNPHPPRKRSRALLNCDPTFFKQIRASALAGSQFPASMTDAIGTITKPADWT